MDGKPDEPFPFASEDGSDALVGKTIANRYRIENKLGEGGMGAVYRARHISLDKEVALKVLHGEFVRKRDLVERFLQEARAASKIRHENVIDITDFGATPEGLVFFAMELLDGRDLHDLITRAKLDGEHIPWRRTRRIFLQVCSALTAAHSHGIIHRDLKPENIFLIDWGGQKDFVKLLDFGIAKMAESGADGERRLTKTGMIFGTPEFMAPEQARGEKPDHRVDVYAMGCILYQLVAGRVPFEADSFMGILTRHMTDPPPPIGNALHEIGAPPDLEPVIMRALAKKREERYQTIEEFADDVKLYGGEPTATTTPVHPPPHRRTRTRWTGSAVLSALEAPAAEAQAPAKRGFPWFAAAALAALGAGAAVAVYALGRADSNKGAAHASDAPAADERAEPAAAPDQPAVDPARTLTLTLSSNPPGARVIDESTGEPVGSGEQVLYVGKPGLAKTFRFELDGYRPASMAITPEDDGAFVVPLVPTGDETAGQGDVDDLVAVPEATGAARVKRRDKPGSAPDVVVVEPEASEAPKDAERKDRKRDHESRRDRDRDEHEEGPTPASDPMVDPDKPKGDKPEGDKPKGDKPKGDLDEPALKKFPGM